MYNPQLDTFIRVADAGSFNKAAEAAYITPTAVIKQINLLESDLGVRLFERTHRGLKLTKAGISLYKDTKYIIQYCRDSVIRARNAMQEDGGIIRIGTSPMTPAQILVRLWPKIHELCPDLKFQLIPFENTPENAREILQGAKDYADEVIRKYNKWSTQGGLGKEMEAERSALRDKLGDTDDKLAVRTGKKGKGKKEASPEDFKVGDTVMVLSLNLKGTVSTPPNAKGDLYVQMGVLRSLVNIKDLEHVQSEEEPKEKKSTQAGKIQMSKTLSISPELNLIGKRVDEALPILDKYLDDAYLAHLPKVTIIHGRGTGALRDAVQAHLKRTKYVKSFRIGGFGEGDHGVTIVEFK